MSPFTERVLHGEVVPTPTFPAKNALPVVVAFPEMVSPPAPVPLPMVVEAKNMLFPLNVLLSARSVEDAAVMVMFDPPLNDTPLMVRGV